MYDELILVVFQCLSLQPLLSGGCTDFKKDINLSGTTAATKHNSL